MAYQTTKEIKTKTKGGLIGLGFVWCILSILIALVLIACFSAEIAWLFGKDPMTLAEAEETGKLKSGALVEVPTEYVLGEYAEVTTKINGVIPIGKAHHYVLGFEGKNGDSVISISLKGKKGEEQLEELTTKTMSYMNGYSDYTSTKKFIGKVSTLGTERQFWNDVKSAVSYYVYDLNIDCGVTKPKIVMWGLLAIALVSLFFGLGIASFANAANYNKYLAKVQAMKAKAAGVPVMSGNPMSMGYQGATGYQNGPDYNSAPGYQPYENQSVNPNTVEHQPETPDTIAFTPGQNVKNPASQFGIDPSNYGVDSLQYGTNDTNNNL